MKANLTIHLINYKLLTHVPILTLHTRISLFLAEDGEKFDTFQESDAKWTRSIDKPILSAY